MKTYSSLTIDGTKSPARSYSFGGRGGIWAILKDPTRVSGRYNGAVNGDVELVIRCDRKITDLFYEQTAAGVDREKNPLDALLRVQRVSDRGKHLGFVDFEFYDVVFQTLRLNAAEKTAGDDWITLTLVFDRVEVRPAN